MRPLRRDEPRQREAERGLAGAGFADDAERLAGAQRQVDAIDGLHVIDGPAQEAGLDRKPDLEVLGLDDDRLLESIGRRLALGSAASRCLV